MSFILYYIILCSVVRVSSIQGPLSQFNFRINKDFSYKLQNHFRPLEDEATHLLASRDVCMICTYRVS